MATKNVYWLVIALLLAACGGDEGENNATPTCADGEVYNPISGSCVPRAANPTDTGVAVDDVGSDMGVDMNTAPDLPPDMPAEPDLGCLTDADGDGAIAVECGGNDCDDTNPNRSPDLAERCDEFDNDCDGDLNEELACSVLAHSSTRLYRVDFFAGTYEDLGETVEGLYDIDTHPDGTLYGIADSKLYTFNPANSTWSPSAGTLALNEVPNGFCIDNEGNAYLTGLNVLRSVDLTTGNSTQVGSMAPVNSSGDCVVNKGNVLFVTSSHTEPDSFARVVGATGQSTIIGRSQHDAIWGLTAAYNRVFGMTESGNVVEINVATGATTLIASYPELSFYGAASSPSR